MKQDTFYCEMTDNIGQMRIDRANEEIQRMQNQTSMKWRMDFSKFLYVFDETDYYVNNPAELKDGYCWVVTDKEPI